jgi:translation elongation factor EF-G
MVIGIQNTTTYYIKWQYTLGNVNGKSPQEVRAQKPEKVWPPLSVRLDSDIREGLEKAAKDDMRPVSHLVAKIVSDWLKEKGYLK